MVPCLVSVQRGFVLYVFHDGRLNHPVVFTIQCVSCLFSVIEQYTSLANFTICINKMKTKSFDIYSEEIKRDEVVDISYKSTFV